MTPALPASELDALRCWLAAAGRQEAAAGYQGRILVWEGGSRPLVVKEAIGFGPLLWIRRWMLRREHAIYRRLEGYPWAPSCFGLLDGRYLLLERIDGEPFRWADFQDRERFFELLREAIRELHRRGVAHGDLKRKENLLVVEGERPCLLDFGTAVLLPEGRRPLRGWLFDTLCQFDRNAWAKLKSGGRIESLAPEEQVFYRRTLAERIPQGIKRSWLHLWHGPGGPPPKNRQQPPPLVPPPSDDD